MEEQRKGESKDAGGSGAQSAIDAGGIALATLGKPII